jgi:hypothetical protein
MKLKEQKWVYYYSNFLVDIEKKTNIQLLIIFPLPLNCFSIIISGIRKNEIKRAKNKSIIIQSF